MRHRREQDREIFLGVAEQLLPLHDPLVAGRRQVRRRRQIFDVDQMVGEPASVRLRGRELALDLIVGHDASLSRVHEEQPAGMQALFEQDVFGRDVEHADLGRHDHEIVLGDVIARRTQAVAIEHGADHACRR